MGKRILQILRPCPSKVASSFGEDFFSKLLFLLVYYNSHLLLL
jgi:hypothetical protein